MSLDTKELLRIDFEVGTLIHDASELASTGQCATFQEACLCSLEDYLTNLDSQVELNVIRLYVSRILNDMYGSKKGDS